MKYIICQVLLPISFLIVSSVQSPSPEPAAGKAIGHPAGGEEPIRPPPREPSTVDTSPGGNDDSADNGGTSSGSGGNGEGSGSVASGLSGQERNAGEPASTPTDGQANEQAHDNLEHILEKAGEIVEKLVEAIADEANSQTSTTYYFKGYLPTRPVSELLAASTASSYSAVPYPSDPSFAPEDDLEYYTSVYNAEIRAAASAASSVAATQTDGTSTRAGSMATPIGDVSTGSAYTPKVNQIGAACGSYGSLGLRAICSVLAAVGATMILL